jgi:hypothetical protein
MDFIGGAQDVDLAHAYLIKNNTFLSIGIFSEHVTFWREVHTDCNGIKDDSCSAKLHSECILTLLSLKSWWMTSWMAASWA